VGAPVWSAAVAGTVTAGGCFLFDLSRASLRVRSHQGRVDSLAWRKRAGIRDPDGGFGDCPGTRHLSTDRAPVPGAAHARCVRERGETARLGLTVGMVGADGSNRRHSPCKGDAVFALAEIVETISARPYTFRRGPGNGPGPVVLLAKIVETISARPYTFRRGPGNGPGPVVLLAKIVET